MPFFAPTLSGGPRELRPRLAEAKQPNGHGSPERPCPVADLCPTTPRGVRAGSCSRHRCPHSAQSPPSNRRRRAFVCSVCGGVRIPVEDPTIVRSTRTARLLSGPWLRDWRAPSGASWRSSSAGSVVFSVLVLWLTLNSRILPLWPSVVAGLAVLVPFAFGIFAWLGRASVRANCPRPRIRLDRRSRRHRSRTRRRARRGRRSRTRPESPSVTPTSFSPACRPRASWPARRRPKEAANTHSSRRVRLELRSPCLRPGKSCNTKGAARSPTSADRSSSGKGDAERAALSAALDVTGDDDASRAHVHGFHSYPARLHPTTARRLIRRTIFPRRCRARPFLRKRHGPRRGRLAGRRVLGVDANRSPSSSSG